MLETTSSQEQAITRLYHRYLSGDNVPTKPQSRPQFRKRFANYGSYIGGELWGMFFGIEKDGYTHT